MEFIGTLRIRKEGTGYTIKYNSLYFYFNSVEYSQLKKVYALITDNKNISDKQKKTQIYSFLYATGNVPRSGISVSENYADFICLNSKRIKKSNKFRKDLAFFLDTFFTTAKIAICDKEKKILSLSNKERVYDDLLAMEKNNVVDTIFLIKVESESCDKIIGSQSFFGQVASKPCSQICGTAIFAENFMPEDKFKNYILIKEFTEPTDLPIMGSAKGIITEEGGLTSHAAIVSRELGKPCLIGVEGCTKILKDGDKIKVVDGNIYKIN